MLLSVILKKGDQKKMFKKASKRSKERKITILKKIVKFLKNGGKKKQPEKIQIYLTNSEKMKLDKWKPVGFTLEEALFLLGFKFEHNQ